MVELSKSFDCPEDLIEPVLKLLLISDEIVSIGHRFYVSGAYQTAKEEMRDAILHLHRRSPATLSVSLKSLWSSGRHQSSRPLLEAALETMVEIGEILRLGDRIKLAEFEPRLSLRRLRFLEAVKNELATNPLQPPTLVQISLGVHAPVQAVKDALDDCKLLGEVVEIAAEVYFLTTEMNKLMERLSGDFGTAIFSRKDFRTYLKLNRAHADPIFSYLQSQEILTGEAEGFRIQTNSDRADSTV